MTPNPTADPTTSFPTQDPTFCDDLPGQDSSTGLDQTIFDYDEINITKIAYQLGLADNQVISYDGNRDNSYSGETVTCENGGENEPFDCSITCQDTSCLLSSIESFDPNYDDPYYANTIIIDCVDTFSCFASKFESTSNSKIIIICRKKDSCSQMSITTTNFSSFKLYCHESSSCDDISINLEIHENYTEYHGSVTCIQPNSCDAAHVTTNSEYTQLVMYEYSEEIKFDNGIGYLFDIQNIICNNDRWIPFST